MDALLARAIEARRAGRLREAAEAWCDLGLQARDAGDFPGAATHFRAALQDQPDCARAYDLLGRLLYRVGRLDDAEAVYRQWLAHDPNDAVARHMVASLSGRDAPERADDRFIAATFDRLAASFDTRLRDLGYQVPETIAMTLMMSVSSAAGRDILDAGCGTGLCGPLLRPLASRLVGIDLSENMLALARETQSYDDLVLAELCEYMESQPAGFDVVVAADTLEYSGSLERVSRAARTTLRDGGLFVFTVEALPDQEAPYKLQVHGRYAHAATYVRSSLEQAGFDVIQLRSEILRMERNEAVDGLLVVARARA
jgi:predicted TPR repeat methyltransferase